MFEQLKKRILESSVFGQNNYYINDKNDLSFIFSAHAIAAFFILPFFSFLLYQTELPVFYFYLAISYSVCFPFYFILCNTVAVLRKSIIHFFSFHLFIITLIAYWQLMKSNFQINELLVFFGFFCISIIVIQRWFALMLYNIFVFLLLLYGLIYAENLEFSIYLVVQLFVIIGLVSSLTLHTIKKRNSILKQYNSLLEESLENQNSAFVLFEFNPDLNVVAHSKRLKLEIENFELNEENIKDSFFLLFQKEELNSIKKLQNGILFKKGIYYIKKGGKNTTELSIKKMPSSEGKLKFLAVFSNGTELEKIKEEKLVLQRRYDNLYFKNKAGVFTLNKKGELIKCNTSFLEMFDNNYTIGDTLFNNSTGEEWYMILESLNQSGDSNNYQTQLVLNNKKEKNVIFSWYLDTSSDTIEGSVIDLTSIQKTSQALKQSEQKYRLIYEETNDAILLLENDTIIDVNRKATQLFGIIRKELLGIKLFELSASLTEVSNNKYQGNIKRLENVKSIKFNWIFKGKNKTIEAEVNLIEITIGKKLFYQCVIHDNTDSNANLRALRKNQRNLENILENNPEGILIVNKGEVLYKNTSTEKLIGNKIDFHSIFQKTDQKQFEKEYNKHLEDRKRKNGQYKINNEDVLTDVTLVSTNYEEEEATLIIIKDISAQIKLDKEKLRAEFAEETNKQLEKEIKERIKAEQLLEEQFLRTKAIIDSSNYTFLLTLDFGGQITSFNKHFETYFKKITNLDLELSENYLKYFSLVVSEQRLLTFETMLKTIKSGKSYKFEALLKSGDKSYWLEVFMSPIFDTIGEVKEVSMVAHDSSEKKLISLNISESLKEKEILLKEIHHRVKNNLQVISSILNLQSSFVTDENTLEILQESRNRIRSMAIIHENLYRTEDFSSINFSSYLENLLANLVASYRINEEVLLETNMEEVDLILDQAIPCGLLMNELITNSLKYAWKQGEKGTITINLKQEKTTIHLNVFDDGVGLPFNFYEKKTETLGLQLVETLIEQLDGQLDVQNENGTKYFIKFENIKTK